MVVPFVVIASVSMEFMVRGVKYVQRKTPLLVLCWFRFIRLVITVKSYLLLMCSKLHKLFVLLSTFLNYA